MFHGSVSYSAETVKKMEKVRYRTFSLLTSLARIACACVMVVCGYAVGGKSGTLLVALGCILAVSSDVIGRWRCDQTIRALGGGTIHVSYRFLETGFLTSAGKEETLCAYKDLICLLEDEGYYYLFPNEHQVYMMEKESLRPKEGDRFRTLLAKGCDQEWLRPLSLVTVNLKQIIHFVKTVNRKRNRGSR